MRKLKYVKLFENFTDEQLLKTDERIIVPIYGYDKKLGKPTNYTDNDSKLKYSKIDDYDYIQRLKEYHPLVKNFNENSKKYIYSAEIFQFNSGNVYLIRTFDRDGVPNKWDKDNKILKGWIIGTDYLDTTEFSTIENFKGCIYRSDLEKCSITDLKDLEVAFSRLGLWVTVKK